MGKGGSAKQQVNEYNLSMHFGISSQVDALTGIYVGEKLVWSGNQATEAAIQISKEDLFGGPKKEGGVRGIAYYLPGGDTQVLPQGLAARQNLTSTTAPAYRGLSSLYFVGSMNPGLGFYWGATPYLQSVWTTVRRAPKGLDPAYAMIGNQLTVSLNGYVVTIGATTATLVDGHVTLVAGHSVSLTVSSIEAVRTLVIDGTTIIVTPYVLDSDGNHNSGTTVNINSGSDVVVSNGYAIVGGITVNAAGSVISVTMGSPAGTDANPAHIIYEALTNVTWGMGATDALVDKAAFEAMGQVLYHEGFGMSLQWTRESSIEQFISEVQDHIQAALYVDPDTGKLTPKLFRDDFDDTTLPLITPDNAVLDNFQRKLWGETVNEIIVTWTNPANEQEQTITQQDLGNITVQGATISDTRNYYGVRNGDLASRLAVRDVRQSSAPLASVDATVDRSFWNGKPGTVLRLSWPEYGIVNLVMRVTNIDYGKIGDMSITVSLLEDIFSLEDASFDTAPTTGHVSTSLPPTPMTHMRVITAPAYFTSRLLSAADADALTYPDVLTAVLGATDNLDASFYEMVGLTTLPNGSQVAEVLSTNGLLGYTTLQTAIVSEASTTIADFGIVSPGIGPNIAGFMFIGDVNEQIMEIALIDSYDVATDTWTISRGVLDTVPRAWPAGTAVWFYDVRGNFIDDARNSDGESVSYKFLTVTSQGILDVAAAPIQGSVLTGRPYYPNRPANVVIAGQAFGSVDLSSSSPASIPITWANRNRTMEDMVVLRWNDATVPPEVGQTTTIRLNKTTDGSLIANLTGLTGTSYSLASSSFNGNFEADVTVLAERDGDESLMGITRRVRIAPDPANPGGTVGAPTTPTTGGPNYTPPVQYPPTQTSPGYGGGTRPRTTSTA